MMRTNVEIQNYFLLDFFINIKGLFCPDNVAPFKINFSLSSEITKPWMWFRFSLLSGLFNLFDVFCFHLGASGVVKVLYRKEK